MYRRSKKYQEQVAYLTAARAVCPWDTLPIIPHILYFTLRDC